MIAAAVELLPDVESDCCGAPVYRNERGSRRCQSCRKRCKDIPDRANRAAAQKKLRHRGHRQPIYAPLVYSFRRPREN